MKITAKQGDIVIIEGYPRKIVLFAGRNGVDIHVEGYGEYGAEREDGRPVTLDFFGVDGHGCGDPCTCPPEYEDPRILIRADINNEEPTHTVSLRGARKTSIRKLDSDAD